MNELVVKFINLSSYIVLINFVYSLLKVVIRMFKPRHNLVKRYGNNTWALITGGSEGIGKAVSNELASSGFNIILVARNKYNLENLSKELIRKYSIKCEYIIFDFEERTEYDFYFRKFNCYFKEKEISILVNNVGCLIPSNFINHTIEDCIKIIRINCFPQAYLSKIFLEHRKNKGAIISLSSVSAEFIMPYFNTYCGTKKFNDYLSKGLAIEFPELDILSVRPAGVESNLSQMKNNFFTATSAENCAKSILDSLGYENETNGFWFHRLQAYFLNFLPECIVVKMSEILFKIIFRKRLKKA